MQGRTDHSLCDTYLVVPDLVLSTWDLADNAVWSLFWYRSLHQASDPKQLPSYLTSPWNKHHTNSCLIVSQNQWQTLRFKQPHPHWIPQPRSLLAQEYLWVWWLHVYLEWFYLSCDIFRIVWRWHFKQSLFGWRETEQWSIRLLSPDQTLNNGKQKAHNISSFIFISFYFVLI